MTKRDKEKGCVMAWCVCVVMGERDVSGEVRA